MKITVTGIDEKEGKVTAEIEMTQVNGKLTVKVLSCKTESQKLTKRKELKNVQPSFERSLGIC